MRLLSTTSRTGLACAHVSGSWVRHSWSISIVHPFTVIVNKAASAPFKDYCNHAVQVAALNNIHVWVTSICGVRPSDAMGVMVGSSHLCPCDQCEDTDICVSCANTVFQRVISLMLRAVEVEE